MAGPLPRSELVGGEDGHAFPGQVKPTSRSVNRCAHSHLAGKIPIEGAARRQVLKRTAAPSSAGLLFAARDQWTSKVHRRRLAKFLFDLEFDELTIIECG